MVMAFKRHLRAEVVPSEATTYVISERGIAAFDDPGVAVVAPLLDGTRDFRSLVADAAPLCSPMDVALAIGRLSEAHLLDGDAPPPEAPDPAASAAAAYWELAGAPGPAQTAAAVAVIAVGGANAEAAAAVCAASGLALAEDGCPADLTLVVCDNYLDPALADLDARMRAEGRVWLLAKPHGTTPWVGPFFRPGESACWQCLAHRMSGHRGTELHLRQALGRPVAHPPAETAASLRLGRQLAAAECVKWLAGHRGASQDGVTAFDTLTFSTNLHRLAPRPQCPGCGEPDLVARQVRRPVQLRPRPKAETSGGGHRAATADATWRAYQHLISPVTGVVKAVQRDTRGPAALNSFRAGHNHAVGSRGLTAAASQLRSESGGKGFTELDARVSALCESLERHSGSYQGDEPRIRASWRQVAGRAVHPSACQLYDRRQGYAPLDDGAPVDWTPVWSLTRGEHRLMPTALLYYDAPREPALGQVRADSNGNAGGASMEDAVLQGFLELVERDAVALWWYNRTRHRAVDTASFTDPRLDAILRLHASLHRQVWVLDVTSDFGIPVFAAVTRRTDKPAEDILFGFGAHFDPAVALSRALCEMNQMMPAVIDAGPDGGYGCPDERLLRWWSTATVADHPYLAPDPSAAPATREGFGYAPRADLCEDVLACEAAVHERGMEMFVLDQTRPDIGLPVVKVIVPGMRHFWARFAPGRLFDVPVALGRLAQPTRYEDLNPTPMFL